MTEPRIWVNGQEGAAGLIPDEGFFFGRAVFETISVTNRPLFLAEHLKRLAEGASRIGIRRSLSEGEVNEWIAGQDLRDCALKITLSQENTVYTVRANPYGEAMERDGIIAVVGAGRRNACSLLAGIKTASYAENLLERERAAEMGCQEALLLNTEGWLAEGSATNLFFVLDGILCTPSSDCGILPGIVRSFMLERFPVQEGQYALNDLLRAEECFLTNSLMGVMGIRELRDHRKWPVGPVTSRLQVAYRKETGSCAT